MPPLPDALVELLRSLKQVQAGRRGAALALWGEAGVGKSHLIDGLTTELPFSVLRASASASMARLASLLPDPGTLPPWAARNLARLRAGEQAEPAPTLLAALAAAAPVLLVLEDAHDADPSRLDLLEALAAGARRSPGVGLLISSRRRPGVGFEAQRLLPLQREAAEAVLAARLGATLPTAAASWIQQRAQGNPLFGLAYLDLLRREGHLWNDGRRWRWQAPAAAAMPLTVEAVVRRQLAVLAEEPSLLETARSRALLGAEAGAALGAAFGAHWAALACLDPRRLRAAAEDLRRLGLLAEEDLVHPLYREVLLHDLPPSDRQRLSRLALDLLAEEPAWVLRLLEDAALPAAEEAPRLRRAAEALAARRDHRGEASARGRLAELAMASAETDLVAQRGGLALEAARAMGGVDLPRKAALAEAATAWLDDPSPALLLLAEALAALGRHQEAQAALQRLPAELREGPTGFLYRLRTLHEAGQSKELLQVWESHPSFHAGCPVPELAHVAEAYLADGQPQPAAALIETRWAQEDLRPEERRELQESMARLCFYRGDYHQAEAHFDRLLRGSEATLTPRRAGWLRNRAVVRQLLGEYLAGLADLEAAMAVLAEEGRAIYYAQTQVMASHVHLECGDPEQARELAEDALNVFRRAGAVDAFHVDALAMLTDVHLHADPAPNADLLRAHAEEASEVAERIDLAHARAMAAQLRAGVAVRFAGEEEALAVADQALRQAEALGGLPEYAYNAHGMRAEALERLGLRAEAGEAWRAAERLAEEHELWVEAQKAGLGVDRLRGDVASAARRLAWFEARRLRRGAEMVRRAFPELRPGLHGVAAASAAAIRLEVLGPMQIVREGRTAPVRGRKRKELLSVLLCARIAGRPGLPSLALLDAVYPGEPEPTAATALKQLVFQLRRGLGPSAILNAGDGYAIGTMASDAEDFLAGGDGRLWRGLGPEDGGGELVESVRSRLLQALEVAAGAQVDSDPAEAARLAGLLVEADPYDLAPLAMLLRALLAGGQYRAMERAFGQASLRFAEVGTALPPTWEGFLATVAAPRPANRPSES